MAIEIERKIWSEEEEENGMGVWEGGEGSGRVTSIETLSPPLSCDSPPFRPLRASRTISNCVLGSRVFGYRCAIAALAHFAAVPPYERLVLRATHKWRADTTQYTALGSLKLECRTLERIEREDGTTEEEENASDRHGDRRDDELCNWNWNRAARPRLLRSEWLRGCG